MSSGYHKIWCWSVRLDERRIEKYCIKTRNLITMNGSLHPKGNISRLSLARKEGGRGLTSCEECVNVEVQSLNKYLSEKEEWMFKFAAGEKKLSEVEDPDVFKKRLKEEKRSQ